MLRVAAFSGGLDVPSARFRLRQYIPLLHREGIEVKEFCTKLGAYPPVQRLIRPFWAIGLIMERIPTVLRSWEFDLTFLQREMLSTYVTLEPQTKRPRVFDVDDAIWLNRGGGFARRVATMCDAIICGNAYLAEWFCRWNRNVSVLPTPVDTDYFTPAPPSDQDSEVIIGWCGTSGGFRYLYRIEQALCQVLKRNRNVRLRVVADKRPNFETIPDEQLDYIPWSASDEQRAVQGMTIGIMPLDDTPWERGKCSFKMLMYMACGIPVVVSPVGMNREILQLGDIGFGAITASEWVDALECLLTDEKARAQLGKHGRQVAIDYFSVRSLAPRLAKCLQQVAGTYS